MAEERSQNCNNGKNNSQTTIEYHDASADEQDDGCCLCLHNNGHTTLNTDSLRSAALFCLSFQVAIKWLLRAQASRVSAAAAAEYKLSSSSMIVHVGLEDSFPCSSLG